WSRILPSGSPPPAREGASAIYDPVRRRMLIFGGDAGGASLAYSNDAWTLSLDGSPAWTKFSPSGVPPSPRSHATAVYDPVRDRMLVFGGLSPAGFPDTVWALSLGPNPSWSVIAANGSPGGRLDHSAIYDPVLDRMVV